MKNLKFIEFVISQAKDPETIEFLTNLLFEINREVDTNE